jgi:sec-independent protein translocase protein TatB
MGFGEILLVGLIAIIFLGPDKLPETMVNIAKFFRSAKQTISDTKESIESELNIAELKSEALEYKQQIEKNTTNLYSDARNESREIGEIFSDLKESATPPSPSFETSEKAMPSNDEIKASVKAKRERKAEEKAALEADTQQATNSAMDDLEAGFDQPLQMQEIEEVSLDEVKEVHGSEVAKNEEPKIKKENKDA